MITSIDLPNKFQEKINELLLGNKNENDLRKKIDSGEKTKQIFRDMAIILSKREKFYEAVYFVKKCIEIDCNDTTSLNILGLIFGIFELDQRAIEQFEKAQEIDPKNTLSKECLKYYQKAKPSLFRRFQLKFMNTITQFMMFLYETEEYRYLQGLAEEELGNIEKAAKLYKRAIRIYLSPGVYRPLENWDKAHLALTALEAERCNYGKSIQLYKDAIRINPSNIRIEYDLATVKELSGDLSGAVKLLKPHGRYNYSLARRIDDLEKAIKNGWSLI